MSHLELSHLSKTFGPTRAVHDVSLKVSRGEILSILGPSGCGKTTTLRMIAGLETPTSGAILSNGRDITKLPARVRNIGMVFQNYALFPHLNVFENVAFGLKTRRLPAATIQARVTKALASVRMAEYTARQVHQLSGGQQQRIALARALAIEPEVLLLDEPLSNLDPSLREDLRDEIRNIIRELNVTTVFVTHDQQEALALADRVAIMRLGVCLQEGPPEAVYNAPADAFVAGFLGKANLIPARYTGAGLEIGPGIQVDWSGPVPESGGLLLFIRPENITVAPLEGSLNPPDASVLSLNGVVTKSIFEGSIVTYTLEFSGIPLVSRQFHSGQKRISSGEPVLIRIPAAMLRLMPSS